jgi:hypothetical protein
MKIRLILPALVVSVLAAASPFSFIQQALTTQIAFAQGNQSRNQGQNQQGLSPEKKRSLSKLGPEDAFPGADEQEDRRSQSARTAPRPQTSPTSRPSANPRSSATPIATPSLAVATMTSASPNPSPSPTAVVAALSNPVQQLAPPQRSSVGRPASEWTTPVLSVLALIVSVALIYVLFKLREKIREGSSG